MLDGINWVAMFKPSGSVLEVMIRGTIMYLGLFMLLRVFMRRQAGGLGMSDLLVIVVIADAAQNGFAGEYKSITEGFALVLTIIFWDYAIDWLGYHVPWFDRFARPKALLLIENGKIHRENLDQEQITLDELMCQLRLQGVDRIGDVKLAHIEGDGRVSVVRRSGADAQDPESERRPQP